MPPPPPPPTEWRRYAALGAVGTTFAGSLLLISPFVFMQLRSELPYMSTPRRKVLKALECVLNRQGGGGGGSNRQRLISSKEVTRRRRNFYDIGSGDGEAVLAAAGAGWNATGIELNPTLWMISQLRRILFSPSHVRRRSRFILGDMFKHNIQSADAVMIFGVRPLMPRIASKIAKECKAGTCVLSYRFRIPTIQGEMVNNNDEDEIDDRVLDDNNNAMLDATMVFDDEEMRVWAINAKKD